MASANKCAGTSSDFYQDVMALAWPLRALHETGNSKMIPSLLRIATQMATGVVPVSSRAESIVLLIHAVLPAGLPTANPAISSLTSLCNDQHWRVIRAFDEAALLVNGYDRKRAIEIAGSIPVTNKRESTLKRIHKGEEMEPRPFLW